MNTTYPQIKKMSLLLLVADIHRSVEFYTKELNFDVDFRYEDFYVGIIKDGYSIHLKADEYPPEEIKRKRNNEDLSIIFSVTSIEGLYKELSNRPVDIVQSLRGMPYGKEFYIADPDNNVIAFVEEA